MIITDEQVRAARSLLKWPRIKLAFLSDIGVHLLKNIETGEGTVSATNLERVRAALESAGVIIVEENGEGPGVRLKKAK